MPDGPTELPGFEIEGVLGRGGFGRVHRGRRQLDGRAVAIKLALPGDEAREMLLRECAWLEAVGAAVAPALLARGVLPDGRPWAALELIEGPSLDRLAAAGVTVGDALELVAAVARAVALVHAQGVVHGDVKPANVFVQADRSRARLIDFGVARRVGDPAPHDVRRGTPAYMAPEQLEPRGAPAGAADVYALGVILYELLAGQGPFEGSAAELQQAHLARRPPPLPAARAVPEPVEALVRACLAKHPADRPDAARLHQRLAELARAPEAPAASRAVAPAPSPPASTVHRMGLLAFEPRCDATRLQRLVQAMGGRIGHAAPGRTIALFDSETSHAPFGRLVRAAQTLAYERAITRGIAGVADVTIHHRRGRELLMSPAFGDPALELARVPERWLGILSTAEHLLGDVPLWPPPAGELPGLPLSDEYFQTGSLAVTAHHEPLIGCARLVEEMLAACRRAVGERRPAVHVVLGMPGVGKSYVAGALASQLPRALGGADLLALRAPESLLGEPFELTAEMLRWLLELPSEAPGDGGAALLAERLPAELGPAAAVALSWLAPSAPAALRFSAPGALRAAVTRALVHALLARAGGAGLAIVLDDVQQAEDIVLDALDAAVLPEHAAGLAVIVLGRALPAGRALWGRRAGVFSATELAPLPPGDAELLARRLLVPVEYVPRDAIAQLVERARGVPRLLVEIVRGLRADGAIRVEPGTGRAILALDRLDEDLGGSIAEWSAERELRALPPPLRGHARLAALLGGPFALDELASVIAILERAGAGDEVPLDARVSLERLAHAGLVVSLEPGRFDVRDPVLRDAIAHTTPAGFRAQVHEAAYHHHASQPDAQEPWRLARLAHHAERSADPGRAIEPLLVLGRQANARHLYLRADTTLSRALGLLPDDDRRRGCALRDRGTARYRLGRYAEAPDDLGAARAHAASVLQQADLLLDEAMALDWMVDYPRSQAAVDEAARLVDGAAVPPVLALRLLVAHSRSELRRGELAAAAARLCEADRLAAELGDDAYESRVVALLMLAPLLAMLGYAGDSAELFRRARALCEASHDRMHLISVIQNEIPLYMVHQDHAGAVAAIDRARVLSRELGLVASEYRQLQNLTDIHLQAGQLAEAQVQAQRTAELAALVHGDAPRPEVALLFGRLYMLEGQLEAAARAIAPIAPCSPGFDGLGQAERLLVRAIALACARYDRDAWQGLAAEAEALTGQSDIVEVFDLMSRAAVRAGALEAARAARARFEALAEATPCFYRLRCGT